MDYMKILLERIDWTNDAFASAKTKYDIGDVPGAIDEIIDYFRTRKTPNYLFTREDMAKFDDESILDDAEETMRNYIYGHQFECDIDWHFNPTAETSRDNEWSWSLYRHIYWQPLARAYVMTGDEKYTTQFLKHLREWAEAWPVEEYMASPTEVKSGFPGHSWRTIESAIRIYTVWLPCYYAFRNSQCWQRDDWVLFLNLVWQHGEFLMDHYSNHGRSSNWLTMESSGLFQCGIMFPEFAESSKWFHTAYRRVMHELRYSFDNDGIHMERTPIYHMVAAQAYLQCCMLCQKNGYEIPPYAMPTFERAARFVMSIIKPDFSTPMIGDADRNDLLTRRCDTSVYEGMNLTFDPYDLNEMRAYFRVMHELTGAEDFLYFATGGKQGKAPEKLNYEMREAGMYVMRTGWQAQDSYFHLHAPHLELGEKSTHTHYDQCHLELHIKGEDILLDTGRYIYHSSIWTDWRSYIMSPAAHNTLWVDDHVMGTVPGLDRTRGGRSMCHSFEQTDSYAVIDLSHNGYAYLDDPIFHRRRVVRLRADIYVIDDRITGLGESEHDMRLYFNFAPGELVSETGSSWLYKTAKSGSSYLLSSLCTANVNGVMLYGSEEPKGGWVSYGYPIREPAPQLSLRVTGKAPIRFITLIAPPDVRISGNVDMEKAILKLEGGYTSSLVLGADDIEVDRGK